MQADLEDMRYCKAWQTELWHLPGVGVGGNAR